MDSYWIHWVIILYCHYLFEAQMPQDLASGAWCPSSTPSGSSSPLSCHSEVLQAFPVSSLHLPRHQPALQEALVSFWWLLSVLTAVGVHSGALPLLDKHLVAFSLPSWNEILSNFIPGSLKK